MKSLRIYYLTRFIIIALISAMFAWSGMPWWMVGLVFILGAGFFLWAPLSGRYRVIPDANSAPLRMDERGRQVRDRAGRNAFLLMQILTLVLYLYGQFQESQSIPAAAVGIVLAIGMLSYLVLSLLYERSLLRE
ncbi:MAG: hypothetical protein PVF49_00715 [Anaerolineales bacterium]|jgi:drug/metabolite transporter (DMT)-like permease